VLGYGTGEKTSIVNPLARESRLTRRIPEGRERKGGDAHLTFRGEKVGHNWGLGGNQKCANVGHTVERLWT